MKTRYTTVDIIAIINELKKFISYRVVKVYDIDCKTFLIKLSKTGEEGKITLLIESGTRIHTTDFDWPKNNTPSGMSMKMRKHIKNRRLIAINQVGSDRIIDLQFGSNECAYHFIAELYDRGNLILTDFEYTILHCGRTRVDNVEHKVIVKERYPIEDAKVTDYIHEEDKYRTQIQEALFNAKPSDNIRKVVSSLFVYGPNLLEHCVLKYSYTLNTKLNQILKSISEEELTNNLYSAMVDAQKFIENFKLSSAKGFIYGQMKEGDNSEVSIYEDFHPIQFKQLENKPYKEVASFNEAVDMFFSSIGAQKTEQQISQKEKAAMKKLDNIKQDHEKRLRELHDAQEIDKIKGELIEKNLDLVNQIIITLNHAVANQVLWEDIKEMVKEGQKSKDSLVYSIVSLNLENNKFTLRLQDPFEVEYDDSSDDEEQGKLPYVDTEIDLSLNAYSNARRYFTMKKAASSKEQKTLSSTTKAMKSAEIKTKQMLNEVQAVAKINKARKLNWFEKFNWFISSENYLVVGGRDQSQNEVLVKRYMRPGDVYMHADIHGASTIIIQNHQYPLHRDIPPKTLNEAGNMAVVYSGAWANKISASAWWVYHDQVSKTAPSGEYLTAGSFMIRGKKNYLAVSPLTFGFGVIFKLSEESIQNHFDERKVKCDLEEVVEENIAEDFDEVLSEESDSEFPNKKIDSTKLEDVVEESVMCDGEKRKIITDKGRYDQRKGCEKKVVVVRENVINKCPEQEGKCEGGPLKRRQRSKLKKMEKYKDQDEEERELKMAILHGKNPFEDLENLKPLTKKEKRKKAEEMKNKKTEDMKNKNTEEIKNINSNVSDIKSEEKVKLDHVKQNEFNKDDLVEDDEEDLTGECQTVLNSLTGMPSGDDELLYALPMCAPYQTLQNYKFKVKMLPGTTKRGKAGKTTLFNFTMDKAISGREKELIKALKDQDITRSFPGTVKIYTPNVSKIGNKNKKML